MIFDNAILAMYATLADWERTVKATHKKNYTESEFDAPLSFSDMKTLNATLRLYDIDREEFMEILNRYIKIKEDSDEV